jgi:hypothetical protein
VIINSSEGSTEVESLNAESWRDATSAFGELGATAKAQWLADLIAALTQAARETYGANGSGAQDHADLRRIIELLHRISNQLRHQLRGESVFPDEIFFAMLQNETAILKIDFKKLKALM